MPIITPIPDVHTPLNTYITRFGLCVKATCVCVVCVWYVYKIGYTHTPTPVHTYVRKLMPEQEQYGYTRFTVTVIKVHVSVFVSSRTDIVLPLIFQCTLCGSRLCLHLS